MLTLFVTESICTLFLLESLESPLMYCCCHCSVVIGGSLGLSDVHMGRGQQIIVVHQQIVAMTIDEGEGHRRARGLFWGSCFTMISCELRGKSVHLARFYQLWTWILEPWKSGRICARPPWEIFCQSDAVQGFARHPRQRGWLHRLVVIC